MTCSGSAEDKRPRTALATFSKGMSRPYSTKVLQANSTGLSERPLSVNTAMLEYNPSPAKGSFRLTLGQARPLSNIADQSQDATKLAKRASTRQDMSIRKNSRLHVMLPSDVVMLKGEVLRSAISHHEMYTMKQQNKAKKDLFDMYSLKKKPSIQSVKWKPEHSGLVMSGQTIDPEGSTYGRNLRVPYDKQLQRGGKRQFSGVNASTDSRKASQGEYRDSRLEAEMRKHKRALQNEGVEVDQSYRDPRR